MVQESELIVIGHRNPDVDSVAGASAYAEFKCLAGEKNAVAACVGLPGARAEYLFKRFNRELPRSVSNLEPVVADIMRNDAPVLSEKQTLFSAIELFEQNHISRLPAVDRNNKYSGCLCLFEILGGLLQNRESGLTGRRVRTSLNAIIQVLDGDALSLKNPACEQDFEVFVAAMNVESFKEHVPRDRPGELAIVVGDRSDIHLLGIGLGVRLMIITGSRRIDPVVLEAARAKGVSIIKTKFDSAACVRRIKFASPVGKMLDKNVPVFPPERALASVRAEIAGSSADNFPVVDGNNNYIGSFTRAALDCCRGSRLVLVDHNEFDQSVPGINESQVIEVLDHHRLSMPPSPYPFKVTCDVVGSTCTLIYEMFRLARFVIAPSTAGILLGGIVSDTLMLRSPTTTERDRKAVKALEKLCGVQGKVLMQELFSIGSPIARCSAREVLELDRKLFSGAKGAFSISQVEESGFDEFNRAQKELAAAAKNMAEEEKMEFFGLLVTDVVRENSLLLAVGNPVVMCKLPWRRVGDCLFDLPGVLSRKKQLLPVLLKIFE